MAYHYLPNGKIKYYWVGSPLSWIENDPIDGVNGIRRWLLDIVPDHESILDIGCGPGQVSEIFRRAGRDNKYLGIDYDIETIKLAKSLFPKADFDVQDAYFLPYKDKSFDSCLLFGVLECCPGFRKPIDEALRVAKKQVIIVNWLPLTEGKSIRTNKVDNFGNYLISFNRHNFTSYIQSFGLVMSGVLQYAGKNEYYWWVINKYNCIFAHWLHWLPFYSHLARIVKFFA